MGLKIKVGVVATVFVAMMVTMSAVALPQGITINAGMHAGSLAAPLYLYGPEFEKQWNVKINVVEIPYEVFYTKMMIELATQSGAFDIIWAPATYFGDFVPYLLPVDRYIPLADPHLDDIITKFREEVCFYGGKFYGGIYDGDVVVYYYRKDLFDDPVNAATFQLMYGYKLAPAKTWEQYLDIAEFFCESVSGLDVDKSGKIGDFWGVTEEYRKERSYTFWGAKFFGYQSEEDRGLYFVPDTMQPLVNSEAGIKAEQIRMDLLKFAPPGNLGWGYGEAGGASMGGDIAQQTSWASLGTQALDPSQSKIVGKWYIAPMPGGATIFSGTSIIAVVATTKIPEMAYRFSTYLTGPEVTLKAAADPTTGVDPSRYSHFTPGGLEPAWLYSMIPANIDIGYPELNIPGTGRLNEILGTYTMKAEAEGLTAKQAMDAVAADWKKLVERMGLARIKQAYLQSMSWKLNK